MVFERSSGSQPGSDPESSSSLRPSSGSASPCAQCNLLVEEAAARAREFHAHVLPRTLPRLLSRLAARPTHPCSLRSRLRASLCPRLAGPLAVAVAALLYLAWPLPPPASPTVAVKGAAGFPPHILLRRHGAVTIIDDGATLQPGDALAFSVPTGVARYALVVSIDGAQRINVYSPFAGEASALIPLGAGVASVSLEPAIILDEVLGPERLWLLLSESPLSVASLRPTLERLAAAGPAAVRAAGARALLADVPLPVDAVTWLFVKRSP